MEKKISDSMAELAAVAAMRDLLADERVESRGYSVDLSSGDAEVIAQVALSNHTANFERRDGLRRVVLAGEWEVDPAAVAAGQAREVVVPA
jgi:hypothetical protein